MRLVRYETAACFKPQCALEEGCKLEVVSALPTHDPAGNPYDVGLAGEHQRINAALALRLCAAWMEEALQQQQDLLLIANQQESTSGIDKMGKTAPNGDGGDNGRCSRKRRLKLCCPFKGGKPDLEAFMSSPAVHKGLSECSWPGRCQVEEASGCLEIIKYFASLLLYLSDLYKPCCGHL